MIGASINPAPIPNNPKEMKIIGSDLACANVIQAVIFGKVTNNIVFRRPI